MHITSLFGFILAFYFLTVSSLPDNGKNANNNTRQIIDNIDDVTVLHYGSDPCIVFEPKIPDFRAPGRRISEVKCFEHVWRIKFNQQEAVRVVECLIKKKQRRLIAGGSDAEAGQYAHMAAIGWMGTGGKWIFKCGSSLISDKFLLTAAHCSRTASIDTTVTDPLPKIVRLGGHSINDYDRDGVKAVDVDIKRFISHPQYRPPRKYYDIALIEMVRAVRFEWMVHPACLGSSLELQSVPATVTGWGVVDLATLRTSPILQVAEIDLMTSTECQTKLRFGWNRNFRGLLDNQLCAGYMPGGIDACLGDSGGPIQVLVKRITLDEDLAPWYLHRVLGVTSFGYGCARRDTPGVYTRVASFIDWIEQNVWPETS